MSLKINNKIVWEKWVDPYFQDSESEAQWSNYQEPEDDEESEEIQPTEKMFVISSPMGIIPYNEYSAPSKIFNFWVGHANFDITEKIAKIIEQSRGVEILDVFTRYRFRIAIGKGFQDRDVMNVINNSIGLYFNEQ
tara:strand:+ start:830 stop:1237 length:408 start_codon:yes stop_codon:yes gene_type:complete